MQRSDQAREPSTRLEKWFGVAEKDLVDGEMSLEELVVLKALFDQNLARFEEADQAIFRSIATSMFRSVDSDKAGGGSVEQGLLDMAVKQGLQPEAGFLSSAQRLKELLGSH